MKRTGFILLLLLSTLFPGNKLKSLILPGWGEISSGYQTRGQFLLGTDVLLWINVLGGSDLSAQYQSDYTAYATEHAGVDWDNTDYLFAVDLGYYDSLQEYNDEKARQRSLEIRTAPSGELVREYGHAIYPENGDFSWEWDTHSRRVEYNNLRVKSAQWEKVASFAVAGLIVNRVVSVVDVLFLERTGHPTGISSHVDYKKGERVNLSISVPINF